MFSSSPKYTQKLGYEFGKTLKGGELVLFSGILGAGKTVFIRGIAKALQIKSKITSPTFNVFRVYKCVFPSTGKVGKIYHFDCYRLKKMNDLEELGWNEIMQEENSVILLEWPECILDIKYLKKPIKVSILINREDNGRVVEIN